MSEDMFPGEEENYYHKHNVEIHLCIMVFNREERDKSRFFLTPDGELPHVVLQRQENIYHAVGRIFKHYFDYTLTPWLTVEQAGIIDNAKPDILVVLHSTIIPEPLPIVNNRGEWTSLTRIVEGKDIKPHTTQLMAASIWRK